MLPPAAIVVTPFCVAPFAVEPFAVAQFGLSSRAVAALAYLTFGVGLVPLDFAYSRSRLSSSSHDFLAGRTSDVSRCAFVPLSLVPFAVAPYMQRPSIPPPALSLLEPHASSAS